MKAVECIQRHAARTTLRFAVDQAEFQASGRAAAAAAQPVSTGMPPPDQRSPTCTDPQHE